MVLAQGSLIGKSGLGTKFRKVSSSVALEHMGLLSEIGGPYSLAA